MLILVLENACIYKFKSDGLVRWLFCYDWCGLLKITVPSKIPDEESIFFEKETLVAVSL